ncbi:MAG: hypothetical protein NTU95_06090 [Methanothrix sp.]|nr:hypothetical protein [Methanothrix sp.]
MDLNFTYPIVLNAILNQLPQNLLANPAITTLLGVVIGWLLNFSASIIQEKKQYRINRMQRQEQAYSELMGLRLMTDQLYLLMNDAYTLSAWINARERLQLPSLAKLGKIEEKHRECNELIFELARNNQRLWETIGLIQVLFSPSEELERLISPFEPAIIKLREHRELIVDYYERATVDNVDNPPHVATEEIEESIHKYVDIPFEALQKYLGDQINAEKIRAKHWW